MLMSSLGLYSAHHAFAKPADVTELREKKKLSTKHKLKAKLRPNSKNHHATSSSN